MQKANLLVTLLIIIAGMITSRLGWTGKKFTERSTNGIIYLFAPGLTFSALNQLAYSFSQAFVSFIAACVLIFTVGISVSVFCNSRKYLTRHVILPVTFMNTANLGYPLTIALFGLNALPLAVSYSVAVTMLHFTYGIYQVSNRPDFAGRMRDIFRLPLIYAFLLGLVFKGRHLPGIIRVPFTILGLPTVPLMLFLLGTDITRIKIKKENIKKTLKGLSVRMGGGLLLGILFVNFFSVSSPAREVIVLLSGMPPAVMSYLLTKKFDADPEFAASMVLIGTLLCPALVLFVYFFI